MKGPVFGFLGAPDMSAVAYPCNDGQSECAGQDGAPTEEERGGVASCDVNQPTCTRKRQDVSPPFRTGAAAASIVPQAFSHYSVFRLNVAACGRSSLDGYPPTPKSSYFLKTTQEL